MVILHHLGVFNVYKQPRRSTDLFDTDMTDLTEEDNHVDMEDDKGFKWYYCVELKDFSQPLFDSE